MAGQIDCSCEDILPDGNLPGDVMVSILSNLPVKSLLKFKAVSKPWCSFISSPRFFKLHLHRQSLIPNNFLVSFGESLGAWVDCTFGLLTHNPDKINTADIDLLTLESESSFSSKNKWIIHSCNGLVCMCALFGCPMLFFLWNPATRKYRSLELRDSDYQYLLTSTFGLCYVEAINDFKLVGWTTPVNRPPCLFVYSLSSDSWEKLDYDAKNALVSFQHPTFMGGCMHWLAETCTCAKVIVTFDVTDGAISCFGVPDKNRGFESTKSMCTLVIKGCLSIVLNPSFEEMEKGFDVWVMLEYGVEESWVKQFTIQGLTQVMIPIISRNDSEIVFMSSNMGSSFLTFYDPFNKKKYYLEFKFLDVYRVLNYVESLASVGAGRSGSEREVESLASVGAGRNGRWRA